MHHVVKHIVASSLFIAILATPKLAFDYVGSPVSLDATLAPQAVKTSVKPLSELQKIAVQVREWPTKTASLEQEIGATGSSASLEDEDDSDGDESEIEEEDAPEIIKLDKIFFDYVMNTYVKRRQVR